MGQTVKFEAANDPNVTAVGAASAPAGSLVAGQDYYVVATVACWIKLGAAPTAVANTDGNMYVPANVPIPLARQGSLVDLAVIRDSVDGYICLFRVGGAP
jgi:hypothetical protein